MGVVVMVVVAKCVTVDFYFALAGWAMRADRPDDVGGKWKSFNRFIQPVIDYVRIIQLKNGNRNFFLLKLQNLQ